MDKCCKQYQCLRLRPDERVELDAAVVQVQATARNLLQQTTVSLAHEQVTLQVYQVLSSNKNTY